MWWMMIAWAATLESAQQAREVHGRGTVEQQQAAAAAVIHEWGTFTSAHGPDGGSVGWYSVDNGHPLPSFVASPRYRSGSTIFETRSDCGSPESIDRGKNNCVATIRMETPVIYVHVPAPARMRITVGFDQGQHTEWYPAVRSSRYAPIHVLDWGWFTADPFDTTPLIREAEPSPYYAAREVDAATLRVDGERERFLFYRGVGGFAPTVNPTTTVDEVRWDGTGAEAVIVYERDHDSAGATLLTRAGVARRSALSEDPRDLLREALLGQGLYADEVEAMLATWESDWFEPGLRAFYLMPSDEIDRRLPLTVEPEPRDIVRVIVGRAELFDPAVIAAAQGADEATLFERHGRFSVAVAAARDGSLE